MNKEQQYLMKCDRIHKTNLRSRKIQSLSGRKERQKQQSQNDRDKKAVDQHIKTLQCISRVKIEGNTGSHVSGTSRSEKCIL